jgi:hypothetical protein
MGRVMSDNVGTTHSASKWRWLVWLFAVLGVLGAVAAIFLAVVVNGAFRQREPALVADAQGAEQFAIGNIGSVPGRNLLVVEIGRAASGGGSGSVKVYDNDRRNILLLDQSSGATRRILSDNKGRILEYGFLPAAITSPKGNVDELTFDDASEKNPAAYYAVQIAEPKPEKPTADYDGTLTLSLLIGTIDSAHQGIVAKGLEGIDKMWMLNATQIAMIVREKKTLYYRIVDIPTLKIVKSTPINIG